jgi:hypothetical protein
MIKKSQICQRQFAGVNCNGRKSEIIKFYDNSLTDLIIYLLFN